MTAITPADVLLAALTTRALPSEDRPLSSREVWTLLASHPIEEVTTWAQQPEPEARSDLAHRAQRLLRRSAAAAALLEQWQSEGIWTLTAVSAEYPAQLRDRLGHAAPALLHGVGDASTLSRGGAGVVGSRKVTQEGLAVCRDAGREASARGLVLVSGAARGADSEAMDAATAAGGTAAGIPADGLRRVVRNRDYRRLVHEERLCLATPYHPDAGFTPAAAMGRNKIIYGLSATVLVVACEEGSGGTWSGAVEALKGAWTDVAVWTGAGAGSGNQALAQLGARPISGIEALWDAPPAPTASSVQLELDM